MSILKYLKALLCQDTVEHLQTKRRDIPTIKEMERLHYESGQEKKKFHAMVSQKYLFLTIESPDTTIEQLNRAKHAMLSVHIGGENNF